MKSALRSLGGLALLLGVAWAGIYFYWHIRILGAIRTLETQMISSDSPPGDASGVLVDAGCRALPYLVGSVDASKNIFYLTWATKRITAAADAPGYEDGTWPPPVGERMKEWRVTPDDSGVQRQAKCEAIRSWWSAQRSRHHQTWRIWSDLCPPPR